TRIIPLRTRLQQAGHEQTVGSNHHLRIAGLHRKDQIMELEIARDSGKLQSALNHSKRCIPVLIHDPITQRTVIRADQQTDAALLAEPYQRNETFTDSVKFSAILLITVLLEGEFLGIGIVPRVNT